MRAFQFKRTKFFPVQPINTNCAANHAGLPILQLLAGPYKVTESRIQQVIDILSSHGEDNPNLAAAARGIQPYDIYNSMRQAFRSVLGKINVL